MTLAVEDICNIALDEIGYPKHIGDIYEGSPAARVALEFYGQTRDELLRARDWSFSRKVAALTLLKGPPPDGGYNLTQPWSIYYPIPGFLYEYTYPSDCVDLRAIISPPGVMPDLDPVPALWRIDYDATPVISGSSAIGPAAKVILCNQTFAMAVYRARVTNPALWEPGFMAALIAALAKKFAKALRSDAAIIKDQEGNAAVVESVAASVRG